jgi:hypothetical protein
MDKAWLADRLAAGSSIEALARAAGRDPSTVAYWVQKHGLASQHAAKHAPRGGIAREVLEPLVAEGLTVRAIGETLGVGGTTVRHWLKKHGLRTASTRVAAPAERPPVIVRSCRTHGHTVFLRSADGRRYRCRRLKLQLVAEAGGACRLCGYDRYAGALEFHHVDPSTKAFAIADGGLARSLERARAEAAKCVLVCANCHAELEGGIATIARAAPG